MTLMVTALVLVGQCTRQTGAAGFAPCSPRSQGSSFNLVPSHGELVNCCSQSAKHNFSPGSSCRRAVKEQGSPPAVAQCLQLLIESAEFSRLPQTTWAFQNDLIEKVTLKLILTTLPDWFFCEEEVSVTLEEFVFAVLSLLVSLCHKKKYEKIKKLLIYEWLDTTGN